MYIRTLLPTSPTVRESVLHALSLLGLAAPALAQANPWTILPSPTTGTGDNQLFAVDGTGPNDVWAVGFRVVNGPYESLALHWDGSAWTQVPTPTPTDGFWIKSVDALAPGEAWGVGGYGVPYAFHHVGGAWSAELLPLPGPLGNYVEDVVALAPDNVWAVGYSYHDQASTITRRTAIWHWNGAAWSLVPSPNVSGTSHSSMLFSITAAAPDALYAVGNWYAAGIWHPLAMRWDGVSWQLQATPNSPFGNGRLRSVTAVTANDVWAVGTAADQGPFHIGNYAKSLAMHWDGSAWAIVPTPQPSSTGQNPLRAVYAAADQVYAVGCMQNSSDRYDTFALQLDVGAGTGFTPMAGANIPGSGQGWNELVGIARIGEELWSVGFGTSSQYGIPPAGEPMRTLVERAALFPSITTFCAGDGSATPCPCANTGAPGHGCGWSANAAGGMLRGTGHSSLGSDTLVLHGTDMPNSSALYFQGTSPLNGGNGLTFGDGLRCAGGAIARLGTHSNSAGASQYPTGSDLPISVRGHVTTPGTRTYQVWYRNAAAFCSASTFNLTNGSQATWVP